MRLRKSQVTSVARVLFNIDLLLALESSDLIVGPLGGLARTGAGCGMTFSENVEQDMHKRAPGDRQDQADHGVNQNLHQRIILRFQSHDAFDHE